jgi:hypothetical protein
MADVRVSDHAILRYLERAGGFNIENLRAEIARSVATEKRKRQTYVRIGNLIFVVRGKRHEYVVTTVLKAAETTKSKHKGKAK